MWLLTDSWMYDVILNRVAQFLILQPPTSRVKIPHQTQDKLHFDISTKATHLWKTYFKTSFIYLFFNTGWTQTTKSELLWSCWTFRLLLCITHVCLLYSNINDDMMRVKEMTYSLSLCTSNPKNQKKRKIIRKESYIAKKNKGQN